MAIKSKKSEGSISSLIRNAGQVAKANAQAKAIQHVNDPAGRPSFSVSNQQGGLRIFNVLDYIEQPWGLNMKLYPVQRFIVKLYYFLPLDDKEQSITITDKFNTKVLHRFTEVEYLRFLHSEGRCNIGGQDHPRRELLLSIGRRGGKTTLSAIFASYELYRVLSIGNPQDYYGLPTGNRIQLISVATDKDQAGLLFNEVTSHLAKCDYFKPYVANNTLSYVQFRTPADIAKYGPVKRQENGKFTSLNGKASIRITFKSCVAKGLRGSGNIVVIMDEMAHFQDKGQSSAKDIYDAVTPSTAAFSPKDPNDTSKPVGDVEARIICISSPLNKAGKFFELYDLAMKGGDGAKNMLAIQAPTWEVNPTLPPSYYKQKYHADAAVFETEHGAQFSDRVRGWIEREEDLMACVNAELRPKDLGIPRYPHQMGIDVGLMDNGTAIFITHVEQDRIILDYHEVWYAGRSWRESNPHLEDPIHPYARSLENVERLDFEEIANWIEMLTKRFYISDGLFDRWNGLPLEQLLTKKGLTQFKSEFFKTDDTSKMYQEVKLNMYDRKLELYDYIIPGRTRARSEDEIEAESLLRSKHSPFIAELLGLQAEQRSKNMVVVSAPQIAGSYDDMSDAFIRAAYLSAQKMTSFKYVAGAKLRGGQGPAVNQHSLQAYQMRRAKMHGAFSDRPTMRGGGRKFRR